MKEERKVKTKTLNMGSWKINSLPPWTTCFLLLIVICLSFNAVFLIFKNSCLFDWLTSWRNVCYSFFFTFYFHAFTPFLNSTLSFLPFLYIFPLRINKIGNNFQVKSPIFLLLKLKDGRMRWTLPVLFIPEIWQSFFLISVWPWKAAEGGCQKFERCKCRFRQIL